MQSDLSEVFECLRNGEPGQANSLLRHLDKAGSVEAAALYGDLCCNEGKTGSFSRGIAALLSAAERGSDYAAFAIGLLMFDGVQVEEDKKEATAWFRKGVKADYAPALFSLGMMYIEGDFVRRDVARGMQYLHRAAQQPGARNLGWDLKDCHTMDDFLAYVTGECVTMARNNLGLIYGYGYKGIKIDLALATHWLSKAVLCGADTSAELAQITARRRQAATRRAALRRFTPGVIGNWEANEPIESDDDPDQMYAMGRKSELGVGVPKDIVVAVRAYLRALAAKPDHADALFALAEIRFSANGDSYHELYERAAKLGHEQAKQRLREL